MDPKLGLSGLLGFVILIGMGGLIWNRNKLERGIGWQSVRFSTIIIAVPLAGILALNGVLNEAAAAIIAGALGYAFGKQDGGQS